MSTESYQENYQKLKQIADTLRSQQEPDIDALALLLEEAIQSYRICQTRIEQVNQLLKEKLPTDIEDIE